MIDPKRLRRAIYLDVQPIDGGGGRYLVTGGAAPRPVNLEEAGACSCPDALRRAGPCKHVLAVRLATGDREVLRALRQLVEAPAA